MQHKHRLCPCFCGIRDEQTRERTRQATNEPTESANEPEESTNEPDFRQTNPSARLVAGSAGKAFYKTRLIGSLEHRVEFGRAGAIPPGSDRRTNPSAA
jgi:hypothetical protein